MKLTNFFAIALAATSLVSCSDNKADESGFVPFVNSNVKFNSQGVWTDVFSSSTPITYGDYEFSHYGDSEYSYYYGFAPSTSQSTATFTTTADWLKNQWSSVAGGGVYNSTPYLVGAWMEYIDGDTEEIPATPSCKITRKDNGTFKPVGLFVTNTSWAAYTMKNGSEMYPTPFSTGDECTLEITGVRRGMKTGVITVILAGKGEILNEWIPVTLSPLGEIDMIYFQMKSTLSDSYGITNPPTYFCIDGFFVE